MRAARNGIVEFGLLALLSSGACAVHTLRVEVNGGPVLSCPLERAVRDCELEVLGTWLRAGENIIRLRVDPAGSPLPSDVQLHGSG